ncbi:helix-turn-helix domain-containing protein [Nocardioides KLBMP 9356]|uniref:Helix-turn-helix domain-containing protein n=1 Tax=Nocardioides potassii TaxID=2911371 RepID=A0ABS9HGD1_9ACTN|nr:helix-turn-helix domain-containing protein [Nocardioides potassii]MCF6379309.1 helix-turn-helix domain-containing protein [Nocardioides potassii]
MQHDTDRSAQPMLWDDPPPTKADKPRKVTRNGARTSRGMVDASELWTIDEVAAYLGVPKQTVYCWRTSGYGPAGFRVGKHLRWRASTVIAWTLELERQR